VEFLTSRSCGVSTGKAGKGAKRMQQLVNDLLAYSRVGTQGKPLRPTPAGAVLDQVLGGLRQAIGEAGAEVQLAQLLQNLVGNALKFRSERPPRVSVDAKRDGGDGCSRSPTTASASKKNIRTGSSKCSSA
jgi:light-regulated signal transduction histidine kinase (bacteriophytochrome)